MNFLLSLSPKLQLESFKLTHPNWENVPGKATDYRIDWRPGARGGKHAVAIINYEYTLKDKIKKYSADNYYSFSKYIWDGLKNKDEKNAIYYNEVAGYIQNEKYIILANPSPNAFEELTSLQNTLITLIGINRDDSKIFLGNEWVSLSKSVYIQISVYIVALLIFIFLSVSIYRSIPKSKIIK